MKKDRNKKEIRKNNQCSYDNGASGIIYGLGFIGSAIYYVSSANEFFWEGVLGILKALLWPAFLVYELLKFLGA